MEESVASYIIEKLAFILEHHLSIVSDVEAVTARIEAGGGGRESLAKLLGNLRSLRESLGDLLKEIQERLDSLPSSYVDDAFALVGYYLEAAAKTEVRALERASRFIDVSSDLEQIEEVKAAARILLANLNASLKY